MYCCNGALIETTVCFFNSNCWLAMILIPSHSILCMENKVSCHSEFHCSWISYKDTFSTVLQLKDPCVRHVSSDVEGMFLSGLGYQSLDTKDEVPISLKSCRILMQLSHFITMLCGRLLLQRSCD